MTCRETGIWMLSYLKDTVVQAWTDRLGGPLCALEASGIWRDNVAVPTYDVDVRGEPG